MERINDSGVGASFFVWLAASSIYILTTIHRPYSLDEKNSYLDLCIFIFFWLLPKLWQKMKESTPIFQVTGQLVNFVCRPFQLGVVYLREFLLKYSCISLKIPCYDFSNNDESDFLKWVLFEKTLLKS